jgi:hypothetical protein
LPARASCPVGKIVEMTGALAWKYTLCDADAVREVEELPRLENALQTGLAARRDKPALVAPLPQHLPVLGDGFADPQFFKAIARPHRVSDRLRFSVSANGCPVTDYVKCIMLIRQTYFSSPAIEERLGSSVRQLVERGRASAGPLSYPIETLIKVP